ncbi:MAG: AAA family ATPase [Myxococcota bacterium]|jgi:ATP-dependent 26S proteasome regulatory subunit|nr:AAA family ATPase [Myxococcota bacterium]
MSTHLFQAARVEPYGSSLELLAAETQRLQLLLDRQAQLLRFQGTINESNEFQGMFLQESEIDALLTHAGAADSPFLTRVAALDEQIVRLRLEIDRRAQASEEAGIPLSLPHLVRAFGLDPFERDVVLMALAPELDLKFHKLYSYVQNDFTRKRPSINLAINLLRDTFEERVAAREYFSPESPLLRYRMLLLDAAPQGAELTLLTREFKLADRVISFLTGRRTLDENVADFSRLLIPTALLDQVVLPEGTVQHVRGILAATLADPPRLPEDWPVLLFHGPRGAGKKLLAEALARELNRSLLIVDLAGFTLERRPFREALRLVIREAGLQDAFLYIDSYDVLHPEEEDANLRPLVHTLHAALRRYPGIAFLGSSSHEIKLHDVDQRGILRVAFEVPTLPERRLLWERLLPPPAEREADVHASELAEKFKLTGGAIRNALDEAGNIARMRIGETRLGRQDIIAGCRAQLTHRLATLGDRVKKSLTWNDLVVPPDTLERLKDIVKYFRRREFIFDEWGFSEKLPHGRGLSILFSGPPGTGKTMVAGIIAHEMEMDLFKIDLSRVVSKFVGETEKNLAKVFGEAKESHSIILFDEADSLFAKRTEVKSSIDRYANLEVNFLLQKIEAFEGITILTTNFEKSIDEAFKRRLNFRLFFPFPDATARTQLWQKILPDKTPRSPDIDWAWLAERYELAGGNIKNAVLRAAFIAADRGTMVDHDCLERAAELEYEEIGKLAKLGSSSSSA